MRFTPFDLTPPDVIAQLVAGGLLTCLLLLAGRLALAAMRRIWPEHFTPRKK